MSSERSRSGPGAWLVQQHARALNQGTLLIICSLDQVWCADLFPKAAPTADRQAPFAAKGGKTRYRGRKRGCVHEGHTNRVLPHLRISP